MFAHLVSLLLATSLVLAAPSAHAGKRQLGLLSPSNTSTAAPPPTNVSGLVLAPKPFFLSPDYPTVRGTNLGGWLLLEPWITPDLFLTPDLKAINRYIADEYTYTSILGPVEAAARLQQHYATFLSEDDFRQMWMHGLNLVRIPVGTWAFNSSMAEPYVGRIQLPYLAQAIKWADKYGIDVIIDLHGLPGSQNGFDNSGHADGIHFADPSSFVQNSARALSALVDIVELFVNDAQFNGRVAAIEVINEPIVNEHIAASTGSGRTDAIPLDLLKSFVTSAYEMIKMATSPSAIRRPAFLMHDAFMPSGTFDTMFADTSRFVPGTYALDTHLYQAFNGLEKLTDQQHLASACNAAPLLQAEGGSKAKDSKSGNGIRLPVLVGEFSIGTENRCVPYTKCGGRTIADDLRTLNDYDPRPLGTVERLRAGQPDSNAGKGPNVRALSFEATFSRRFFEVQTAVFEANSKGWVYWNWKTQAAAAWSLQTVFAQGWAPSRVDDPSLRLYKYTAGASPCISVNPVHSS
ncbi:hypothetical protein OC846_002526 [Tilletia horrida]|uniref:Glycoside hydrolase family 5 domain-containing protein n=1 Tax=Tilletia horrida TaxID=155126 RepID=A0AAN6JSJ4_9BASI|nr:hypothetical protein OC846_002526 [Tilletia horrida]